MIKNPEISEKVHFVHVPLLGEDKEITVHEFPYLDFGVSKKIEHGIIYTF